MKSAFPHIHNSGEAIYQDGNVTFSWFNSLGQSITETLKILPAKRIAALMVARMGRFQSAGPGSREGEQSREERKYVSAHPRNFIWSTTPAPIASPSTTVASGLNSSM